MGSTSFLPPVAKCCSSITRGRLHYAPPHSPTRRTPLGREREAVSPCTAIHAQLAASAARVLMVPRNTGVILVCCRRPLWTSDPGQLHQITMGSGLMHTHYQELWHAEGWTVVVLLLLCLVGSSRALLVA